MAGLMEVEAAGEVSEKEHLKSIDLDGFFKILSASKASALALDFDGTLAPFRLDPLMVRPWAGVRQLLNQIHAEGRTRLAIISGRPAKQVESQLGLAKTPEIWGLHGSEHLLTNGQLQMEKLLPPQQQALQNAKQVIQQSLLGVRSEEKWNAAVVHWRGKSPRTAQALQERAMALLRPFTSVEGVNLLPFSGGLELRAGSNKGDAVRRLLAGMPTAAPIAYLGDDCTDEDAFRALACRGLGVLVRRDWRPGAAQYWLRPPAQLREFLQRWLVAVSPQSMLRTSQNR